MLQVEDAFDRRDSVQHASLFIMCWKDSASAFYRGKVGQAEVSRCFESICWLLYAFYRQHSGAHSRLISHVQKILTSPQRSTGVRTTMSWVIWKGRTLQPLWWRNLPGRPRVGAGWPQTGIVQGYILPFLCRFARVVLVWETGRVWEPLLMIRLPDWWFGTFFYFPYIGNSHQSWLIFFRGFKPPTNLQCLPVLVHCALRRVFFPMNVRCPHYLPNKC